MKLVRSTKGVSIIEVLIAGAIVGLIALFMFPSLTKVVGFGRQSEFQIKCNAWARAKLNEYMTGAIQSSANSIGQVMNGFQYTRYRYQNVTASANSDACAADPVSKTQPGFREEVFSNSTMALTDPTESAIGRTYLGFQMWVNIRHYNPRSLDANSQPKRLCPANTTPTSPASGNTQYQFLRVGDGLEVTVTGFIRTSTATASGGRGGIAFQDQADLSTGDPNPQLTCQATGIVYPPRQVFRYYLTFDGRIRNYQQNEILTGTTGAYIRGAVPESPETHFRSIWSQDPTAGTLRTWGTPNIRGFAISPDNNTVYIAKPGTLLRYTGCADTARTVNGYSFKGVPDCDAAVVTEWDGILGTVDSITVDFGDTSTTADDVIYGLRNVGVGYAGVGAAANEQKLLKFNTTTFVWEDTSDYTLPAKIRRIRSIFLVPTYPVIASLKPTLYVSDNSCYGGTGATSTTETTYCVNIYNASDTSITYNVGDINFQVIGFSN